VGDLFAVEVDCYMYDNKYEWVSKWLSMVRTLIIGNHDRESGREDEARVEPACVGGTGGVARRS